MAAASRASDLIRKDDERASRPTPPDPEFVADERDWRSKSASARAFVIVVASRVPTESAVESSVVVRRACGGPRARRARDEAPDDRSDVRAYRTRRDGGDGGALGGRYGRGGGRLPPGDGSHAGVGGVGDGLGRLERRVHPLDTAARGTPRGDQRRVARSSSSARRAMPRATPRSSSSSTSSRTPIATPSRSSDGAPTPERRTPPRPDATLRARPPHRRRTRSNRTRGFRV